MGRKPIADKTVLTVTLYPEMYAALVAYREKTGAPLAEIVRRAIVEYFMER